MQTTISDVIVNIQPKDIQISKEYQASQNIQTSTLSFEQLLNEARGISSSENIQNDSSNAEQTKSTNYKSEEKEAEKVSEKEVAKEPVKEDKNLPEKEINEEKISENKVDAESVKTRNQNQKKVKASEDEVDLLKENSKNIDFEMYELQAAEQSAALENQLKAKVRATVENAEQGEITIETDFSDMKIGSKAENLISGKEVKEFALDNVRPTADNVRENLFNIICERVEGATFLDLYSGTGAVWIEALSRGAKKVTFNDSSKDSLKVVKDNLKILSVSDREYIISNCDGINFLQNSKTGRK